MKDRKHIHPMEGKETRLHIYIESVKEGPYGCTVLFPRNMDHSLYCISGEQDELGQYWASGFVLGRCSGIL